MDAKDALNRGFKLLYSIKRDAPGHFFQERVVSVFLSVLQEIKNWKGLAKI